MGRTKPKKLTIVLLILSVFCMFRALNSHADQYDVDETYEASRQDSDEENNEGNGDGGAVAGAIGLPDVRLSRPEEAASRRYVMYGQGEYEQVPGSEVLMAANNGSGAQRAPAAVIEVPQKPKSYTPDQILRAEPMVPAAERFSLSAPKEAAPAAGLRKTEGVAGAVPIREGFEHLSLSSPVRSTASQSADAQSPRLPATRSRGLQEVSLIATEYGYFPRRVFVTQGIPVKVYLSTPGGRASCFMIEGLGVKKGINPGQLDEVTFVADTAGDYRFHCPLGAIEGVITVRSSSQEAVQQEVARSATGLPTQQEVARSATGLPTQQEVARSATGLHTQRSPASSQVVQPDSKSTRTTR